jgi:hypothetical protein
MENRTTEDLLDEVLQKVSTLRYRRDQLEGVLHAIYDRIKPLKGTDLYNDLRCLIEKGIIIED